MKPWLLLAPTLVVMLVTTVFPLGYSVMVSFTRYDLARETGWEFAGLVNYREAVRDQRFLASAIQTVQIIVPALVVSFVLGFGIALLLNRPFRWRGLFVSILAVPIMVAPTAGAMAFALMLTSEVARTAPPSIPTMLGRGGIEWTAIAAGSLGFLIPVVIVVFLLRNYLLRGVTFGAVRK